jgi:hypothetical protein
MCQNINNESSNEAKYFTQWNTLMKISFGTSFKLQMFGHYNGSKGGLCSDLLCTITKISFILILLKGNWPGLIAECVIEHEKLGKPLTGILVDQDSVNHNIRSNIGGTTNNIWMKGV